MSWDVLHNETVAASIGGIVGAISTYLVVALTDSRREKRKARKVVPAVLHQYKTLVESRFNGARAASDALDRTQRVRNMGDRFPVSNIRGYAERLAEYLRPEQGMALLNIAFYMEQADELNRKALHQVDKWEQISDDPTRGESGSRAQVVALVAALKVTYGEEILLLRRVDALIDAFLSDRLTSKGGELAGE